MITLLLVPRGVEVFPVLVGYFILNAAVFFLFRPLSERDWPVAALELIVTIFDAMAIKLLVSVPATHGDQFCGVSWLRAAVISAVGNGASYFVGYLGPYAHAPG